MVDIERRLMRISLPKAFRDDFLSGAEIRQIQEALRGEEQEKNLVVDLSDCEWVDPLPIIALLTELTMWRSRNPSACLTLDLGVYGTADHSKRQARLRKFLLVHGFLDALARHARANFRFDRDASNQPTDYRCERTEEIQALSSTVRSQSISLSYESAEFIPVDVLTFIAADSVQTKVIGSFVDKLVRSADRNLFYQRPSVRPSRDTTLQRMRHVLLELVRNAWEHAYINAADLRGAVAVFARLRHPHHNSQPTVFGSDDHPGSHAESLHCPEIQPIQDRAEGLQIELFVCDVGRGLTADFSKWLRIPHLQGTEELQHLASMVPGTEEWKYPLRHIDRNLFVAPLSRHDRTSSTIARERGSLTGLQYLGHVLGYHGDVTRLGVGGEWVARSHHKSPSRSSPRYSVQRPDEPVLGTFIHVALLVQQTPSLNDKGWTDVADNKWAEYRTQLLARLAQSTAPLRAWPAIEVLDLREAERSGTLQEPSDLKMQARDAFERFGVAPLVRTRRNFEKNSIYPVLDAWLESNSSAAEVLVICDMSRFQCLMVEHVVKGLRRRYERSEEAPQVLNRKSVLLMSEDFASKLYQVITTDADNSIQVHLSLVEIAPAHAAALLKLHVRVATQLRYLDSKAFWSRIDHLQSKGQPVLLGPVMWAPNVVLPHYLDFSLAAHDSRVASILRRSLRRCIALFPECRTAALDELIEAELHDANKWLVRQAEELATGPRLLVGSVLVSGATVNRQQEPYEFEVKGILHALSAPTTRPQGAHNFGVPSLLGLLWKRQEEPTSGSEVPYVRIPDTPYIARRADSLLPIGRVHVRRDIVGTTPAQMYRTFYVDNLIKLGHWTYGGRHSLIENNAVSVLEGSADTDFGFYSWLAGEIEQIANRCTVIVGYPVQRLAASIARTLEKKLAPEMTSKAVKWLPLHYMPTSDGALVRLSPLTVEQLHGLTSAGADPTHFCFIDVGVASSRTFRHTRRQVRALGVTDVSGFVLQNRTSWPTLLEELERSQGHFEGPNSYWRWGIPVFSAAPSCPLCSGLAGLRQLRQLVETNLADVASTIDAVQSQWAPRDLADVWHEHGLEPETLKRPVKKKMGYTGNSAPGNELLERYELVRDDKARPILWHLVEHECSTTLTSHAIEVAASTHRLSYPLSVATKRDPHSKLTPTAALEVLACTLLLLGKDMSLKQQFEYVSAAVDSMLELNSSTDPVQHPVRLQKLLGLTLIAMMGVRSTAKRAVSDQLLNILAIHDIVDPWWRASLIALTRDTNSGAGVYHHAQTAIKSRLLAENVSKRTSSDQYLSPLARNAIRMGLHEMNYRESWLRLSQLFGRGPAHEGSAMRAVMRARDLERDRGLAASGKFASLVLHLPYQPLFTNARDVVSVLGSLHLLAQFDKDELATLEMSFKRWAQPHPDDELTVNPIDEYHFIVNRAREFLWKRLVRFEAGQRVPSVFAIGTLSNLNWSSRSAVFKISNSLPLCEQLIGLIREVVSNAEKHGIATQDPWKKENGHKSKHWIYAECKATEPSTAFLEMEVRNAFLEDRSKLGERAKLNADFLESIGGRCTSDLVRTHDAYTQYSVKIEIPYLSVFANWVKV
jgi:hypothetical protein